MLLKVSRYSILNDDDDDDDDSVADSFKQMKTKGDSMVNPRPPLEAKWEQDKMIMMMIMMMMATPWLETSSRKEAGTERQLPLS